MKGYAAFFTFSTLFDYSSRRALARGPDGEQWPISYLTPFSDAWQLTWKGQWELNAWPNFVITGAALLATLFLAWSRGYAPLEMFSARADKALVETLRHRFSQPNIS